MVDSPLVAPVRVTGPPVCAVVVTHGVTPFLAATLQALAAQTRPPERVVVVDAGSDGARHTSGASTAVADLVAETWAGRGGRDEVTVVGAAGARSLSRAVIRGLAEVVPAAVAPWLWLLHDDSAPEPEALSRLVRAVEGAPSVAVAGCKQRTWADPVRLVSVGSTTSITGRRMAGVDDGEADQGQYDGREDVLAVGTAGALVRRELWDALQGADDALGPWGDGFDLSRRTRLAGHRVIVVPGAIVRHAQAGYNGLRNQSPAAPVAVGDPLPGAVDPALSFAQRRRARLHARLVNSSAFSLVAVSVAILLAAVVRSLVRVASKEPRLAVAELTAPFAALGRPGAVARARRRARATARLPRRTLRPLQGGWRDVWSEVNDRRLARAEQRRAERAPSELEMRDLAVLASRRRTGLAVLVVVLLGVTVAAMGRLVVGVVSGSPLVGQALVRADVTVGGLWRAATTGWIDGSLGAYGPSDPLLLALLPGTAVLGRADVAIAVLLLGGIVLAGVGAWFAAGAASRSATVRLWAALVWAVAPTLLLAIDQGRVGAVLAHVLLPWAALGIARALGVARRDVVETGAETSRRDREAVAVGARPPSDAAAHGVENDTDAVVGTGTDDVRDEDGRAGGSTEAAGVGQAGETAPVGASDEGLAATHAAASSPPRVVAATAERALLAEPVRAAHVDTQTAQPSAAAEPTSPRRSSSVTAAAAAGLALAGVAAGAPVLGAAGLLALAVVALVAHRVRRRVLILSALPTLAVLGPTITRAIDTRSVGGLRLLLADPGHPVASTGAATWEQLLGVPVQGTALDLTWLHGAVADRLPLALGSVVALFAVLALLRGRPVASAVRVGWLVAAIGLGAAFVSSRAEVAATDGTLVRGWPGTGVSLVLLGLLMAAVLGADRVRGRIARRSFGWLQVVTAVLTVVAFLAPVAPAGTWIVRALQDAPSSAHLTILDHRVVPAVAQQEQQSAGRSRVLAISVDATGAAVWQLLRGDGPQLTESAASAFSAGLTGTVLHATPTTPDAAEQEVSTLVAGIVAGSRTDVAASLADLAVTDVLVPAPMASSAPTAAVDGSTGTVPDRAALVARLDSTPGLERITENSSGVVWRISPVADAAPVVTSWARTVVPAAGSTAEQDVAVPATASGVDTQVAAGAPGRLLVLSERADQGWVATLDGAPLRTVAGDWRQTFEIGASGGHLVVAYAPANRTPWLVLQGLVLLLTGLLALPLRRRRAWTS